MAQDEIEVAAGGIPEAACRLVLPNFLSAHECKELEFIHKSCGVVGYRPCVLSTTMSHLVATNCAHLIIPILSIRGRLSSLNNSLTNQIKSVVTPHWELLFVSQERAKEVVEEHFRREYELFVEFTGLISWRRGSSIGWHSDNNRQYLKQRHYSAVIYLNRYDVDFTGGLFHFQEGEPMTVIPSIGAMVIYTADERNLHCVDEIVDGERCTLALWFTSDKTHDEDQKVIDQLSMAVPGLDKEWPPLTQWMFQTAIVNVDASHSLLQSKSGHPVAAPSVMYCVPAVKNPDGQVQLMDNNTDRSSNQNFETTSNDLRVVRMASHGYSCCFTSTDSDDQHDRPVILMYKQRRVPHVFSNSLEALQVVQFHQLKSVLGWQQSPSKVHSKIMSETYGDARRTDEGVFPAREGLVLSHEGFENSANLELDNFICSLGQWVDYKSNLWEKLFKLLSSWRTSGSLLST